MVICLEQGADLPLMPLPLTVSCFSKIQIGFTFLVPAHLDSPGQTAVKWVCVYVCVWTVAMYLAHLDELRDHDNDPGFLLPDHAPEVSDSHR